jgi:NADPH2:quinone reductase
MSTMQVIEITHPGEPDVLQLESRDVPTPGKGEVLIRVAASGVNRPDVFQRRRIMTRA